MTKSKLDKVRRDLNSALVDLRVAKLGPNQSAALLETVEELRKAIVKAS